MFIFAPQTLFINKLIHYIMLQIIVTVERQTSNPQKPFVKLFERIVNLEPAISFPYEQISSSLAFLFGNVNRDLVISFRLSSL